MSGGDSSSKDGQEAAPESCSEPTDSESGGIRISRRQVVIGGSAALVAGYAYADGNTAAHLDVAYGDATRRELVVAWIDPAFPIGKGRFEWRISASTFVEDVSDPSQRFVLRRTSGGWRAQIGRCALPGGYRFRLIFDIAWNPANAPNAAMAPAVPVSPSLKMTLDGAGQTIILQTSDLRALLKADSSSPESVSEIIGDLKSPQVSALTQLLFGETFETKRARNVKLAFHRDGYWILRAGVRPPRGAIEGALDKQNRFLALSSEGLNLPFAEVFFSVFSGNNGGNEGAVVFQIGQQSDAQKQNVRALFSGDGAPPSPEGSAASTLGAKAEDLRNAAAGPRVLYALVRHNVRVFDDSRLEANDDWQGSVKFGIGPGKETALIQLLPASTESYLAWRNAGDMKPVLALQTNMAMEMRPPDAPASRFEPLDGRVWRARDSDGRERLVGSLTPPARGMQVETRFGPVTTAPLPQLPPKPGVPARVPAIQVGGIGAQQSRTLTHFEAPLALERADFPLASSRTLADPLSLDPKAGLMVSAGEQGLFPFSQLLFNETEVIFRIKDLPLQFPWIGPPPPASDPPQAEAIVHVGLVEGVRCPVQVSLSRASLIVRRPSDMLALTFRFQELLLEKWPNGWFLTPDKRLAAFVPSGVPAPQPPETSLICGDQSLASDDPQRYQRRNDPRPLLAVDFPPQHLAEQAFLRQLVAEPRLPVPPSGSDTEPTDSEAETLRNSLLADRLKVRASVSARQTAALNGDDISKRFDAFRKLFGSEIDNENKANSRHIPEDQKTYIGPAFLDPESARVARRLQRSLEQPEDGSTPEGRARLLRAVPEVLLSQTITIDLRKQYHVNDDISEGYPEPVPSYSGTPTTPGDRDNYLTKREDIRKANDYTYAAFSNFYRDQAAKDSRLPTPFYGQRSLIALVESKGATSKDAALAIADVVTAFDQSTQEEFQIPAEARVSGGSRLVFRIPADDYDGGRPDTVQNAPPGSFPFTIEALTNWGAFDLAVVRRAEKVFEPMAGWSAEGEPNAPPDGRFPPSWARQETRDEAAKLLYQGISRGDRWSVRHDEQRNLTGMSSCPLPLARLGTVTAAQRMSEVVANVKEPGLFETLVEVPARLMLSPAQDANWRTPLRLPSILKLPSSDANAVPLWFAVLNESPGASSVRAVWSPDFRPEAFLEPGLGGPPHGPWAPWAMAKDVTSNRPYLDAECTYGGSCGPNDKKPPEKFRTGLDAGDRHELVALTSLYGLPVRGRRKSDGTLSDGSQINPPSGFKIRRAALEILDPSLPPAKQRKEDFSAIYSPQTLGVTELSLTALGANFDADTNFVPPASAKIVPTKNWDPTKPDEPGEALFDALSVERWQQSSRLSRDIRVEVVYKGFLFPLGHRCSLVKLTERRFVSVPGKDGAPVENPVAMLIQRQFLRVGTPLKSYPAIGQPNGGRSWPAEQVEIITRVTPDIVDPADTSPSSQRPKAEETANGRVFLRNADGAAQVLPGLVFWPRVRARPGGEINFELQMDGRGSRTRLPLIFVDNTAANDTGTMAALAAWYSGLADGSAPDSRRILMFGGEKRRYAPEQKPDETSFETQNWVVSVEGREDLIPNISKSRVFSFHNTNFDFGSLLQGNDQPPFYPVLAQASVRIAQVDRITGNSTANIDIRYDDEYRAFGFPADEALSQSLNTPLDDRRAKTDVYLDFVDAVELDPGRRGERTGGPIRPLTSLVAMSRSRGPLGNNKKSMPARLSSVAATPTPPLSTGLDAPTPDSIFGRASLWGVVDLTKAVKFIIDGISGTPQFKEVTQYTSALLTDATDSGAAVAKVRDQLLVPLREALLTLATQFFTATKSGDTFNEDEALSRIERLYPDVGRAYRDLRDALDAALELSQTSTDIDELLGNFATIYGAGRRLLSAIDRVAQDPIAPVREALRDAFNQTISQLITQVENTLGPIAQDLLDKLAKIQDGLEKSLESLLVDAAFAAWRHLALSLPGGHSLPSTLASYVSAVDNAVDDSLSKVNKAAFFVAIVSDNPNWPELAAATLAGDFDKAFNDHINNSSGLERNALVVAYQAWTFGAVSSADAIKGLLFDDPSLPDGPLKIQTLSVLRGVLKAAANLSSQLQGSPKLSDLLGSIRQTVEAVGGTVQPILDYGETTALSICGQAAGLFVTLLGELLPVTSTLFPQLDTLKTPLDASFDAAITKIGLFDPSLVPQATVIKTELDGLLAKTISARDVLGFGVTQLVALSNSICSVNPARLQLDALSTAKRTRDAFMAVLNDIQVSIASNGSSNVGGQLLALLSKLVGTSTAAKEARAATVVALQSSVRTAAALSQIAEQATCLRSVTAANNALANTKAGISALRSTAVGNVVLKAKLDALTAQIDGVAANALSRKNQLDTALQALTNLALKSVPDGTEIAFLADCVSAVSTSAITVNTVRAEIVAQVEQQVLYNVSAFLLAGTPYLEGVLKVSLSVFAPLVLFLDTAQAAVLTTRDSVWTAFGGNPTGAPLPSDKNPFEGDLSDVTFAKVCDLLLVALPNPLRPGLTLPAGNAPDNDYVAAEKNELDRLAAIFGAANPAIDPTVLDQVRGLFSDWAKGQSSAQLLSSALNNAAATILSGDLKRIVDLDGARRKIEEKLKELIPTKLVLNYDLHCDLQPVSVFQPQPGSQITLSAGAAYNLIDLSSPPTFAATCRLDAFNIDVFEVVTLIFSGAEFASKSGSGSDISITYKDFELGPRAEFLKPLESLMNPGGGGPYVRPSSEFPGIEAGYSLDLGIISIGTLSFINVSVNASCTLPFGPQKATFMASIGRADRPVLLSCLPYVGGGFLALYATGSEMIGFAASFEFGGGGAFSFGPLSGQGRISTGIYLSKIDQSVTIEGFFYAGGEAHIACFAISATLVVRISQQTPGGTMQGSAVFTFSFSLGFAKISYSVGVQRKIGKGFSGSGQSALARLSKRTLDDATAYVKCSAVAIEDDWRGHDLYFANVDGFPA